MSLAGAVYDRGYRPYEGPRGGRGAATLALYRASMRRALGLRRSWRQKFAPFVLLAVVTIPAIVNVGIGYVTRDQQFDRIEIITYRDYVGVSSALLVFVALVAPDVICPDRRQKVLPLMFARPLSGPDYVVAKVGAIATILFAFSFIPQVVLFVGNMLVSDGALTYLREHLDVLWEVPVSVALLALFYAVIGVAIASLTDRRIVAGSAIIGLFLVTSIASGVVTEGVDGSSGALLNLLFLPLHLRDIVFLGRIDPFGPLGGVAGGGALATALYVALLVAGVAVATPAACRRPPRPVRSSRPPSWAPPTRRSPSIPPSKSTTSRCGSGPRSPCPS
jgi:ABC-2 type transport system permease protein